MFTRSPTDVIPKMWQAIETKQIPITIFFTGRKLIMLGILPKEANSTSDVVLITFCPIWKRKPEFSLSNPSGDFLVHLNSSRCHDRSKVASKFDMHHISRLLHPLYSPDVNPCDFSLFGMLKGALKHREFNQGRWNW
jgi:hypothetical protein